MCRVYLLAHLKIFFILTLNEREGTKSQKQNNNNEL